MRGLASILGIGALLAACFAIYAMELPFMMLRDVPRVGAIGLFGGMLFLAFDTLLFIACLVMGIRTLRIDIFGPKDIPLVFNRKTRKVYQFAQEVPMFPSSYGVREFLQTLRVLPKYWIESLKPWPMVLVEYDWDCMGAEYKQATSMVGDVVKTVHYLNLHVKESPESNKVIGIVTPVSPMFLGGRENAAALWEFIRRYMEEGGPVLYPGDKPARPIPRSFVQGAQQIQPYYWPLTLGYAGWTTHYLWVNGYEHVTWTFKQAAIEISAFLAILATIALIANWLAHKFGIEPKLPDELMADAGNPLDLQALRN